MLYTEDLFHLINIPFDATKCLANNEQITCIDGSSTFLYFGTSSGSVIRLELQKSNDNNITEYSSGNEDTKTNIKTTTIPSIIDDNPESISGALVLDFMQLPTKSAVSQLIAVPAVDSLIVLSASKLFYIDIYSLQIQSASNSSNIVCLALNNDPLTDDPFTLQMAFGTTSRLLLVGEKSMGNTIQGGLSASSTTSSVPGAFSAIKGSVSMSTMSSNVSTVIKQRFQTNAIIQTLCYSRECICYATATEYFVYNTNGNVHLSLFPYDSTLIKPLILNIDTEEFLVSSMHELAVFAKSTGVSSRPPLCWGNDAVIGSAYHSPYIFALTDSALIVFECNEGVEVCRLKVQSGTLLSNIDGRIYVSNKDAKMFIVTQISWLEQAKILLSKGYVDEALKFAEQSVLEASYDEAEILKLNELKQKIVLSYFGDRQFKKCFDVAVSCEMDPREMLIYYGHLELPSSGGICKLDSTMIKGEEEEGNMMNLLNVTKDSVEYLNFLWEYLREIRKLHWTKTYRKDLDNVLVCLLLIKKEDNEDEDHDDVNSSLIISQQLQQLSPPLQCSLIDCKEWLMKRKRFVFFVNLAFHLDDFKEAFETCRKLFVESQFTTRLHRLCMENLSKVKDAKILLDALQFLTEFDPKSTVQSLDNIRVEIDVVKVMKYFEPYRQELILFLEREKPCWQIMELDTKLTQLYIEEIVKLSTEDNVNKAEKEKNEKNLREYRKKLRNILFESNFLNWSLITDQMKQHSNLFVLENLLLKGKEDASEECLEMLLNDYEEYDAAEFYCLRMQTRNKRLLRILLKAYLKIVKFKPEFKTRIVQILGAVHDTGDELETIAEFPDDWPLEALAPFASKALSSYTYRLHCDQLKTAALSRAVQHLNNQLDQQANAKFIIDDHTRCAICSKLIGADDTILYPRSNVIIHRTCMNHSHLCPKTNVILQ